MTKWAAVWGSLGYLMKGAFATVELSFTVIVIGTVLGLVPRIRQAGKLVSSVYKDSLSA